MTETVNKNYMRKLIVFFTLIIFGAYPALNAQKESEAVNQLVIIANHKGPQISKDIYGHFSEHLGTCISLANLNPNKEIMLTCPLIGETFKSVSAEILTAKEINAHNTFENADAVKPASFNGYKLKDGILTVTMPPKSVVVLGLKK